MHTAPVKSLGLVKQKMDFDFHNNAFLLNPKTYIIVPTKIIKNHNCFHHFSWAENQHIIIISEGSCDNEDWSNDAQNTGINYILTYIVLIFHCNNMFNTITVSTLFESNIFSLGKHKRLLSQNWKILQTPDFWTILSMTIGIKHKCFLITQEEMTNANNKSGLWTNKDQTDQGCIQSSSSKKKK